MPNIIEGIYAFVAEDENGDEGVACLPLEGVIVPMVCADMGRVRELLPFAQLVANARGKRVELRKFVLEGVVERFEPEAVDPIKLCAMLKKELAKLKCELS